MSNLLLTKLKKGTKRWIGRAVYSYVYVENKVKQKYRSIKKGTGSKKKPANLAVVVFEQWKFFLFILVIFLGGYYGIGAAVSSKINNRLGVEYMQNATLENGEHSVAALEYVLKTQIDDVAWTPAIPVIFPAGVLDNMPYFQLGVKDSAYYLLTHLNQRYEDRDLAEAAELLNYPPDIWLVSQTKNDKLAPGSAKQYRKALAKMNVFLNKKPQKTADFADIIYILGSIDNFLHKEISKLNKHVQEHGSEILDFRADDVFYHALGTAYTLHYFLNGLTKDYQKQILAAEQYENITSALKFLADAEEINPLMVKNSSLNDVYEANHLFYLAYYLVLAQNRLQEIYYQILLKTMELKECA